MFNSVNTCKNTMFRICATTQLRSKSAKSRNKILPKERAMDHFNEFYGNVFGEHWPPMREGLLRRQKYVAVINNYGNPEETVDFLCNRGAHCLKELMLVEKDFQDKYAPPAEDTPPTNTKMEVEKQTLHNLENESSTTGNIDVTNTKPEEKPKFKTLEQSLAEAEIDESRIIDPSLGITTEALYQYVPATELKGMDDYILESSHYNYSNLKGNKDFPLVIEPETSFNYPGHLKVLTYEKGSDMTMFPEPKRCNTGVFNYYCLDSGSVLAVLALQLSPGDRMLDLCSAPGGKALIALQTFLPDVVVCNDISISRQNRLNMIFRDYLADYETSNKWRERVVLTRHDGREFSDDQGFDKVLVDVPCTTDRHSVSKLNDNNIFRPDRVRERLRLPELQSQLLVNALRLVRVGGAVVYSTCSLSPAQGDGAVHAALAHAFHHHGALAHVKDLSPCMKALSSTLNYATGSIAPKYGQLVIPSVEANFGPMYVARLERVR